MAFDAGLVAWVEEALEPVARVTMRKMMGVATLYVDGRIFAIVDDAEVWFKADAESAVVWDEAGCDRYTFTEKNGTVQTMNYRRAPPDVHDDAEAMRLWARVAIEASLRAPKKKGKAAPRG